MRSAVRALRGQVLTCDVRGLRIRVGVSTEAEHNRAENYRINEPETLSWIDTGLKDRDVFFDVGANIGLFSMYAALRQPGCRVYAFEPESQNFASLCRNITRNGLKNVVPCNMAVGGREGFDFFYVGELQSGTALHGLGAPNTLRGHASYAVAQGAWATTLDALVGRHGLPQPTLLKIDVDGIEGSILDGARHVLGSPALRSVLVELNSTDRIGDVLPESGFALAGKSEWVSQFGSVTSQNHIYVRT